MTRYRICSFALCAATTFVMLGNFASAQTLVWDGGGAFDNWSNSLNWNPNSVPAVGNDVVINQNVDTNLDQDFDIRGLNLSSGATANTNGHFLEVGNGGIDISLTSRLIIPKNTSGGAALRTTGIDINNIGTLEMSGGLANIAGSVNVNGGGTLTGYGAIQFLNGLAAPTTIFTNNGTLSTGRMSGAAGTTHFVLSIGANDADARIDLDGSTNNRLVNLAENTTLDLNMRALNFGGTMTLNAGTVFDADNQFQTTSTSVMNVNAATGTSGVADTATIRSTAYNALNGSQVNINSGRLILDTPFFFNPATSINMASSTSIQFDQVGTIEGTLDVGSSSQVTVNADTTIDNAAFSFDGANSVAADYEINTGATLTVVADRVRAGNLRYRGDVIVAGGTLDTNFALGDFTFGSTAGLILDAATGNSAVRGDTIDMQGTLTARGGNVPRTVAPLVFRTGSKSLVENNTDMFFLGPVTFEGGSTHTGTGSGEFSFGSNITVNGNTTIDMPGGRVQLDSNNVTQTLAVNSDLTINATSLLSPVGAAGGGQYTINIDNTDATLAINLTNPTSSWTLGGDGTMNITGTGTLQTSLAGSRVNVLGRINVNDPSRFTAPIDLQVGSIMTVDDLLVLNGGSASDPNRMSGGFVNGNGAQLQSTGSRALVGFGTVNPDINFTAGSDVYAEGGILVLNGNVISSDRLGARSTGTLQVNNPLNTADVNVFELEGGTVQGQPIANDGTIRGHGLIRSIGLTSTGTISAEGGQLTINTTNAPDLDEFASTTVLNALTGDLVVVPALTDDFSGTLNVGAGREIEFQAGWIQGIASDMFLTGTASQPATLAGGQSTLRGDVNVTGRAQINAPSTFDSFSEVQLPITSDQLTLKQNSLIENGATFVGQGAIVNEATLTLDHLSNVDAALANEGVLEIAGNGIGKVTVDVLDLLAGGSVVFDLNGTSVFDTISFRNTVNLGGTLEVTLNSFTPSLGDAFPIIASTTGATFGTFAGTNLPSLPGSLNWRIDYTGDAVWLEVVDAISGDFDNNGDYSCNDIDMLVGVIVAGTNDPAFDLTGDGSVNNLDLVAWLAEAGAAELPSGNPYQLGDANLDGFVDGQDFLAWNEHKFTSVAEWCSADFNADGSVDGQDFFLWNDNKFTSADQATVSVPEPSGIMITIGLIVFAVLGPSGYGGDE